MGIINLSDSRYANAAQQSAFFEELLRRVRALPGVQSAAVSDSVPLSGINDQGSFGIEGRSYDFYGPAGNRPHVSAGYFETMSIPVLRGRTFDEHDVANTQKVAVISDLAAGAYWPNQDPIGKRVFIDLDNGRPLWHEIVGIVRSTRHFGIDAPQGCVAPIRQSEPQRLCSPAGAGLEFAGEGAGEDDFQGRSVMVAISSNHITKLASARYSCIRLRSCSDQNRS